MKPIKNFDTHIHVETDEMTPYSALRQIERLGLTAGLVDHVFSDRNRITPKEIKSDCRKKFSLLQYAHGCEADVFGNGEIALDKELAQSMDFVMLSFTHIGQPGVLGQTVVEDTEGLSARLLYLLEAAVEWPYTKVIAHPFALPLEAHKAEEFVRATDKSHLTKLVKDIARKNILVEINSRTLTSKALAPQKMFLQKALEYDCNFTVGSDAHKLEDIGNTTAAWHLIHELKIPLDKIRTPFAPSK